MMMQANFPRIYSLSTIGIKQHFNANYLFHPQRTDFSGESGSGKSMIADMIQLVIVGSNEFRSSTEGNKPRYVKGLVLEPKGKATGRGYVILNVEISAGKFIAIGVYIESTSNHAEHFVIQDGYNPTLIKPMETPVFFQDLVFGGKVETPAIAAEKFSKGVLKAYSRKNYHQFLFENDILALDLSKDETLRSYASILRSFSRGKGFKIESEHLKKFLFGDDDQNIIMQRYNDEVANINNDFHEHRRYLDEIELINDKQQVITTVLEKYNVYQRTYREYLTRKFTYWTILSRKSLQEKDILARQHAEAKVRLLDVQRKIREIELQLLSTYELQKPEGMVDAGPDSLKEKLLEAETNLSKARESQLKIEKVTRWLEEHDKDIQKLRMHYLQQKSQLRDKEDLEKFISFMQQKHIAEAFRSSHWLSDFVTAPALYDSKEAALRAKIEQLELLERFSDINNPESLTGWAKDNLTFPLSLEQESVLIYFQKLTMHTPQRLEAGLRYLPFPGQLFGNIKTEGFAEKGFWLDLNGVLEFIGTSSQRYLNHSDPKALSIALEALKNSVGDELALHRQSLCEMVDFKNTLFGYGDLQRHISLYKNSGNILSFTVDEGLSLDEQHFEDHLRLFEQREQQAEALVYAENSYSALLASSSRETERQKRRSAIEKQFFTGNPATAAGLEAKIQDLYQQRSAINEELQQALLKLSVDPDGLLEDYSSYTTEDQAALLQIESTLRDAFAKADKRSEALDAVLSLAGTKIAEAEESNLVLFSTDMVLLEGEADDPEAGSASLRVRAERAKTSFEERFSAAEEKLADGQKDSSFSVGSLAQRLLPTVFTSSSFDEELITSNIAERLNRLTRDIQEIGSRKIEILKRIFSEVHKVYNNYLAQINEIDEYLKKKNRMITGGNRASLRYIKSIHYPEKWLAPFRRQLDTQLNNTGLFSLLKEEIDINNMMIKAFQEAGGSPKVTPADLMNPKSYFDLEFDLMLNTGETNSGSTGQTYTANALLGLARLSLLEAKSRNGLKIMPIDEAEGLGSNYNMLHELAQRENYQLITMSIETAGEIRVGGQYIYMMNENNMADQESYVPPLGIFSGNIEQDIEQFIDSAGDGEQ